MAGSYISYTRSDGLLSVDSDNLKVDLDQVMVGEIGNINVDNRKELTRVEQQLVDELVARARAKADGDVLQVKTGHFLESIHGDVQVVGGYGRSLARYFAAGGILPHEGVYAEVVSDDPIAHLLEYGGKIPPHEIDPKNMQALRFLGREGIAFAASVDWPGATIAPHPTIHAAFAEMQSEIIQALENAGGLL